MIANERTEVHGRSGELDWLLDDLVARVGEVRHAVVLSNDGLAVGASSALSQPASGMPSSANIRFRCRIAAS